MEQKEKNGRSKIRNAIKRVLNFYRVIDAPPSAHASMRDRRSNDASNETRYRCAIKGKQPRVCRNIGNGIYDERDKVECSWRGIRRKIASGRGKGGEGTTAKARRTFPPSGRLAIIKEVYSYEMHAS